MTAPRPMLGSISTVSPLGLRFLDVATGGEVGDGLVVAAYPVNDPARRLAAYRTWSGRYAFRGLPGLRAFESGKGDADFWNRPPPARGRFVVEVTDSERRFLPFRFAVTAPVRGLFTWKCPQAGPPLSPEGTVPLYSAPARPVPAGMAVMRAGLRDPLRKVSPAWAVLEAHFAGRLLARGLADDKGRVVLLVPYPLPPAPAVVSPPPGSQTPFTKQTWPLQFTARYQPLAPVPAVPDLCDALGQPAARLWANEGRTEPFAGDTLRYGQELVLRTHRDGSPTDALAELFITPP